MCEESEGAKKTSLKLKAELKARAEKLNALKGLELGINNTNGSKNE